MTISFRHPDPHTEAAIQVWKAFHDSHALSPMTIVNDIAEILRSEFPPPVSPAGQAGVPPGCGDACPTSIITAPGGNQ